jgi:NAD(P)-dependent dehydrogenase (short-subunit alcohol dehydrogenase family)
MVEKALNGKVALVTGAGSKRGMGHTIAIRLAREGAKVVVVDKYSAPRSLFSGDEGWKGLDAVVQEIESLGEEALSIAADISNSKEVDEAVKRASGKFGKIDILVNCAAIRGKFNIPVVEFDDQEWVRILAVNLTGAYFISKAVAKDMIRRGKGGKIVHIASLSGKRGSAGSAAYCASKFGVIGLVESMALELAPYKINVNAINPGATVTNLRDEYHEEQSKKSGVTVDEFREQEFKRAGSGIPLGRMGTPDDIANLVLFLVSSQSDYMTGNDINIDGGWILPL